MPTIADTEYLSITILYLFRSFLTKSCYLVLYYSFSFSGSGGDKGGNKKQAC